MSIDEARENVAIRDGDLRSPWRIGASNGHTCQDVTFNYGFPLEEPIGPHNCALQDEFC